MVFLLIFAAALAPAAPATPSWVAGDLDLEFSQNGRVNTDFGGLDQALAVAEADGKIVAVGRTFTAGGWDFAVARYLADGRPDESFSDDGERTLNFGPLDEATGVAIQPDGKIVVAGYSGRFAVARFDTEGRLDTSFGDDDGDGVGDGMVETSFEYGSSSGAYAVAIQPDGKIVAAGWKYNDHYDFALVRYDADGGLDRSFDGDGKVVTGFGGGEEAHAVAIQTTGRFVMGIVAAGESHEDDGPSEFAIARYRPDGELDNRFDEDGKVETRLSRRTASAQAVAIQANGRIVAAGSRAASGDLDFQLIRYMPDGALDKSFDENGTQATEFGGYDGASGLAIQPDSKIVAVGATSAGIGGTTDFALARYDTLGELDKSFGRHETGKVTTHSGYGESASGVDIQADGNIVAAGSTGFGESYNDFAVYRYHGAAN